MSISLFDISIASYRQSLDAFVRLLDKAAAHFGADIEAIVETTLHETMKPFRFQVRSVVHHSVGALEGLRSGHFAPPPPAPPLDFAALRALVGDAAKTMEAVTPEEIEGLADREVLFVAGERRARFAAADFVLTFSLPNLHFHAATAYDILRWKGMPLEKVDYLGRGRILRD